MPRAGVVLFGLSLLPLKLIRARVRISATVRLAKAQVTGWEYPIFCRDYLTSDVQALPRL
jgi:hypothetical protein